MNELQLYKFINQNKLEYQWYNDDVILYIPFYLIEDFIENLLDFSYFDDGGIETILERDYVCLKMENICDYYDIDIKNIFDKDN